MDTRTRSFFLAIMLVLIMISINQSDDLRTTLQGLCKQLADLFKVVLVLTLVLGIVAYSLGQLMSSEMRARANVWAMGMITATLIAAILYALIPWILRKIAGPSAGAGTPADPCQ